jgi:RND superfamily putative drug exporter
MFGAGLALALILDATVIRTVLAPSLMRLAGAANWWRPSFLNGFYDRFRLREGEPEEGSAPVEVPAGRIVGAAEAGGVGTRTATVARDAE